MIKKNTALLVPFNLVNATTGAALTGAGSVVVKLTGDGGASTTSTNAASELANGQYTVQLTAAEMNYDVVGLQVTATNAVPFGTIFFTGIEADVTALNGNQTSAASLNNLFTSTGAKIKLYSGDATAPLIIDSEGAGYAVDIHSENSSGIVITANNYAISISGGLKDIACSLFNGLTSFASWLGVLMGSTADAGTLAEINATTAGIAYDNTTDSLLAIRQQAEAANSYANTSATNTALLLQLEEADVRVDKTTDPAAWDLVYDIAGTNTELLRKPLYDVDGVAISSTSTTIGRVTE